MILGIDIGNSNIVIGCIEKHSVAYVHRLLTDQSINSQDYSIKLKRILDEYNTSLAEVEGVIISSVVHSLTSVFSETIRLLVGKEPLVVSSELNTGLSFDIDTPHELGCDRIADCTAAAKKYTLPLVVVDFGTATTISVVGTGSVFLGGAIAPGLKMSVNALGYGTSQLPTVPIEIPTDCIGKNTQDCIKSGVLLGAASMVDGMAERIENLIGMKLTVIATGGLAPFVVPLCTRKIIIDENLLLSGLGLIYCMNKMNKE